MWLCAPKSTCDNRPTLCLDKVLGRERSGPTLATRGRCRSTARPGFALVEEVGSRGPPAHSIRTTIFNLFHLLALITKILWYTKKYFLAIRPKNPPNPKNQKGIILTYNLPKKKKRINYLSFLLHGLFKKSVSCTCR